MEQARTVTSVSIFGGSPHADTPQAGPSVHVVTDDDQALADRLAEQLAQVAWTHRHEFIHQSLFVPKAVAKALAAEGQPIILADMADNTGGGAAGAGPESLREPPPGGARSTAGACLRC